LLPLFPEFLLQQPPFWHFHKTLFVIGRPEEGEKHNNNKQPTLKGFCCLFIIKYLYIFLPFSLSAQVVGFLVSANSRTQGGTREMICSCFEIKLEASHFAEAAFARLSNALNF